MEMLKRLQGEMKLADDELMIIVYTSLDHDYFTNGLILQGEFLKWFNLDFSEDSREELDFLENKQDIWMATTTLAMEVVTWFGRLQGGYEVILTQKWWMKLRYYHFGNEMKEVFEQNPDLMRELRQLFKKQNDKCSYFDLFQFIANKLDIKLENWEEDALESRLDRLGMAFIEFNEFNEFSMEYGINWGEPLIEGDLEDILDAKLNLSYKDYVVTPADYFQNCPTMFNNEKAALAACRKIWQKLKKEGNHQYKDPDFGPRNSKDEEGNKNSLYKNGVLPQKGYPLPEDIVWKSISELCAPGTRPQFVDDGASS